MKTTIDPVTEKRLLDKASNLIKEGFTNKYVSEQLRNACVGITVVEAQGIVSKAKSTIMQEFSHLAKDIQVLHTKRYNENIEMLLAVEELDRSRIDNGGSDSITFEQWQESRNRKMKAYDEALRTIQQKENLLGIHSETFTFDIDEQIDVTFDAKPQDKPKWDTSKLTLEELVELYEYIKICRVNDQEIKSIVPLDRDESVIEIHGEVVQDQEPNIKLIEQKHIPSPEEDIIGVTDPTSKLKELLRKQAALAFKNAGGNLDDQEKGYLN